MREMICLIIIRQTMRQVICLMFLALKSDYRDPADIDYLHFQKTFTTKNNRAIVKIINSPSGPFFRLFSTPVNNLMTMKRCVLDMANFFLFTVNLICFVSFNSYIYSLTSIMYRGFHEKGSLSYLWCTRDN